MSTINSYKEIASKNLMFVYKGVGEERRNFQNMMKAVRTAETEEAAEEAAEIIVKEYTVVVTDLQGNVDYNLTNDLCIYCGLVESTDDMKAIKASWECDPRNKAKSLYFKYKDQMSFNELLNKLLDL